MSTPRSRDRIRAAFILLGMLATSLLADRALERTDWTVAPALAVSVLPLVVAVYLVLRDVFDDTKGQRK